MQIQNLPFLSQIFYSFQSKSFFVLVTLTCFLSVYSFDYCSYLYATSVSGNYTFMRRQAKKLKSQGNYLEALKIFKELALGKDKDKRKIAYDMREAINCLTTLNRTKEIDSFREKVIKMHKNNWRVLAGAAQTFVDNVHYGAIIDEKFERGPHRGRVNFVNSTQRDRVLAIRLFYKAMKLMESDKKATPSEKYDLYMKFADLIGDCIKRGDSWRLQILTDISKLPDFEKRRFYGRFPWRGRKRYAPVDNANNPIFYKIPSSFDSALNDGERWRYLLRKAALVYPKMKYHIDMLFANFLKTQFGVETMAAAPIRYIIPLTKNLQGSNKAQEKNKSVEPGPYSVQSLEENETIARLASGIKRFTLPDGFNYIKIYKRIARKAPRSYAESALNILAEIFTNRRQYDKAAKYWEESIKRFGSGYNNTKRKKLNQIIGNWGQFEPVGEFTPNKDVVIPFKFRNACKVSFTAYKINVKKILNDIKEYLKSNPAKLKWDKISLNNIGYRLVVMNQKKYIENKVAEWSQVLEPYPKHFDKRINIKTPLKSPGAYFLTAQIENGNTTRIVVWIANAIILRKPMSGKELFFVADAATGKPLSGTKLDIFGYKQDYISKRTIFQKLAGRHYNIITKEVELKTGKRGIVIVSRQQLDSSYRWLITINSENRLAFMGFSSIWYPKYYDPEYNRTKTFFITDRPLYQPGDTVKFKAWVRKAKYDMPGDVSTYADHSFPIVIRNPQNQKVFTSTVTADIYGGIKGKFVIGEDAVLGIYRIEIEGLSGGCSFRVEEYKKPEFEVSLKLPDKPVKLGDKIEAVIKAKYYFGAPVTNAKVKYKVFRYDYNTNWYPPRYWDWLYSPGYWWFYPEYSWIPGWKHWGCIPPHPWWIPMPTKPPELIANNEGNINANGEFTLTIDTAPAKTFFGNTDHRYEIIAEVTDKSRRTIVGKGSIIAARKPFSVFVWTNRGYYTTGDTIKVSFNAHTPDNRPVETSGTLRLIKQFYSNKGAVREKIMREWNIKTDKNGNGTLTITAAIPGTYKLLCCLKNMQSSAEISGGIIITVTGNKIKPADFCFNNLEVINDKCEYKPGDIAKLMVNTKRKESTVLFFIRPVNGVYIRPHFLKINNKTTFVPIKIQKKDMPNIFVEAVTISDGKVYSIVKELAVPPEKKVLNVQVIPAKKKFKPAEQTELKIKITDFFGKPVSGAIVVTVYDKALEYISDGSNIQKIQPFFWKWRRSHYVSGRSTAEKYFYPVLKRHEENMAPLGIFGNLIQSEVEDEETSSLGRPGCLRTFGIHRQKGGFLTKCKEGVCLPSGAVCEDKINVSNKLEVQGEAKKQPQIVPHIRKNFADTAFWADELTSDKNGIVKLSFKLPENLTTWKIKVWSLTSGTRVGEGETEIITSKDLIIRLESPRFFVQSDEVVLSAMVHNYYKRTISADVSINLSGDSLKLVDTSRKVRHLNIKSKNDIRVDWRVKVLKPGKATITMKVVSRNDSDAMQMSFPVFVHGIQKQIAISGNIRQDRKRSSFTIEIPEKRNKETTNLIIRYSPCLAMAMIDALPYLVQYPYGCTEQTLNKFLPAVITRKTLRKLGINLKKVKEKRINLNPQEIGEDKKRNEQWNRKYTGEKSLFINPVWDERLLNDMINTGIRRLDNMQLSDGAWGWFSGYGEYSSPYFTALIVHGLHIAKDCGIRVPKDMLTAGEKWLKNYQAKQILQLKNAETKQHPYKLYCDNLDALVFMTLSEAGIKSQDMTKFLYRDRTKLSLYGIALYGIGISYLNEPEKLKVIVRNLKQFVVRDSENQTAYLNMKNSSFWWYWYGSEIETQAFFLKLLCLTEPKSDLASEIVKYLLNNRKHASYWNSTRDTAYCIEAFADYINKTGESKPDMLVTIKYDNKIVKTQKITADNLFSFNNKFLLSGKQISSGKHYISLSREGYGNLYYNAYLSYFSREDFIKKAGLEVKIKRKIYKLVPQNKKIAVSGAHGQVINQKVEKYKKILLQSGDTLKSGDLCEVQLTVISKNDYEYIVIEDRKPAGFEPLNIRSGYIPSALGAYVEFRTEKVCFFFRNLARGTRTLSYRIKAEIPGKFSSLPTTVKAMYAPELRGNSDEFKIIIED